MEWLNTAREDPLRSTVANEDIEEDFLQSTVANIDFEDKVNFSILSDYPGFILERSDDKATGYLNLGSSTNLDSSPWFALKREYNSTKSFVFFRVLDNPSIGIDSIERERSFYSKATWIEKVDDIQSRLGLNVSHFAEVLCVTRQLLYRWRSNDVDEPSSENLNTIERIHNVLLELKPDVAARARWLGRFPNRKVQDGQTVLHTLCNPSITSTDLEEMVAELQTSIVRMEMRTRRKPEVRPGSDDRSIDDLTPYV